MPKVGKDELEAMLDLSFQQIFVRIASLFVGDEMRTEELEDIVEASFSTFSHDKVVPVVPVEDFYVAELFHGPTYAFKDFGQQGAPPSDPPPPPSPCRQRDTNQRAWGRACVRAANSNQSVRHPRSSLPHD